MSVDADLAKRQNVKDQLDRIEGQQRKIIEALHTKKKFKLGYGEDENEERGNWSGKLDFLLSCLGYAVGLGNVWRFPYLCYKNGGGAFFIPYVIFLFCVGIPLFLVELSLGQFSSEGPLTCWRYAPIFRGIGVGMVLVSSLVAIYYNVIIAWAFWYLFDSFRGTLPYQTCGSWSTALCRTKLKPITFAACTTDPTLQAYGNGTCWNTTTSTLYGIYNKTLAKANNIQEKTPANDYLNYVGLQVAKSPGFENLGPLRWDMSLCLLFSWIVVFLCLCKSIKSSGKVVYFTALFPYAVLIILFINGMMQDGMEEGIKFYITPKLSRLSEATVWKDACVQIFFSLGVCWGGLAALASYNRFHTDVVRDTLIVALGNCCTSVFAGFVIFSYLGSFAKSLGVSVEDVVDSGVGLAFIVYPQAMTTLPAPPFWAILFFLMLITLGLDSEFTLLETVITGISDVFPKLRKYKTLLVLLICVVFFFCSLVMATPGGPYVLTLMDDYSGGWNVQVLGLLISLSLAIYGPLRFTRDIETMIGKKAAGCIPWFIMQWYFVAMWMVIAPCLLIFVMIFSWVKYKPSSYDDRYTFPTWVNAIGWILTMLVICSCFCSMIIHLIITPGSLKERFRALTRPTRHWGPALVKHRKLVTYVEGFIIDPDGAATDMDYKPYESTKGGYENVAYEGQGSRF